MPGLLESLASLAGTNPVTRVRRNHGLEHATLHVLADRFPGKPMGGHSDMGGFWIIGDLETEDLASAVDTALDRLRNGEHELAIHPNCGTNFVTAGVMAGTAALLGMLGAGKRRRDKLERIPLAISLATVALVAAQPLGLRVQEGMTTSGEPGNLRVTEVVKRSNNGKRGVSVHRVATQG